MKPYLKIVLVAACFISFASKAQVNFALRKVSNNEEVSFSSLIANEDGTSKLTFLVTWSGKWCFPCMDVIASLNEAAGSGKVQLIAVNIDDKKWPEVKAEGYHSQWTNAINLYLDTELPNSFHKYFSTSSAPLTLFFDDFGHVQYMASNYNIRAYQFTDYFGKEFIWNASGELNSYAWTYFELHENDGKVIDISDEGMARAMEFIKRSLELEKYYNNVDTYAALLFLNGQYTEALKTAKEAIDLAKVSGEDYEGTNELIQKIIEKM